MKPVQLLIAVAALLFSLLARAQQVEAPRYDIRVEDAPARAFFEGLVDGTGTNMLVHPDVKGRITVALKQVTILEALDAVRDLYGYDYRPVARGYMILPATIQTRVFQLNYLDLQRIGTSKTRVSSGQVTQGSNSQYGDAQSTSSDGTGSEGTNSEVSGTSVLTRNDTDFWKGIEADIRLLVPSSKENNVVINRQSGVIVVRAMPGELHDVAEYLKKTQSTVTRQVVLEAKIVEVELNAGYQAGINWATILQAGSHRFFIGQRSPPGGFDTDPLAPTLANQPVGDNSQLSGFITETLGGALTFALNTPDFSAFIEMLSAQGRTRVLSSPRVSTLHNQKAVIKAGTDEFFVTGVKSDTTTGTSTTTSLDVELTPFFSGVALDVTPQISEDGSVLLHIHPTVSEVNDQNKRVSFGGASSDLPLAISQIRESDSVVRAKSGQVIVIGGLMRETRKRDDYKLPLLGNLPGVGRLFRSERDAGTTVELVLLLRPLVMGDGDWDAMVQEPMARVGELAKQGEVEDNDVTGAHKGKGKKKKKRDP
jgi:MSHA biogenesis protein MshL